MPTIKELPWFLMKWNSLYWLPNVQSAFLIFSSKFLWSQFTLYDSIICIYDTFLLGMHDQIYIIIWERIKVFSSKFLDLYITRLRKYWILTGEFWVSSSMKCACFWTVRLDLVKAHTGTVKTYKPHTEKPELESNTEPSLREVTVLRTAPLWLP